MLSTPFGKDAPAGFTDHAPTLGLAAVHALTCAGGSAPSARHEATLVHRDSSTDPRAGSPSSRRYDLRRKVVNNPSAVPTAAPRLTFGCICSQL